jgi:hypothetical protein
MKKEEEKRRTSKLFYQLEAASREFKGLKFFGFNDFPLSNHLF